MGQFRILSLDGGGSRAGILAVALGRIFGGGTPGREILRQFDLAAGNSGGSIVLTALCCNYTPADVAAFYADPATVRRMFSPRWSAVFKRIPPLRLLFPPYSAKGKFAALNDLFDRNRQAGEPAPSTIRLVDWPKYLRSEIDLLVTAYDYDRERATFFRSNHASLAQSSSLHVAPTLAEAVHASTNAPVYFFDEPAEFRGRRYWDGGLAAFDNPVLAAVVEAMANHPGRTDDIRVLSIGTGTIVQASTDDGAQPPLGAPPADTGLSTTLKKAGLAVLADPPGTASFHAYVALGQRMPTKSEASPPDAHVVRMSPFVRPIFDKATGEWTPPEGLTTDEFADLVELASDAMGPRDLALIQKMGNLWISGAIPNQPIRTGERMRCDIGDDTFAEAIAHWARIAAPRSRDGDES
jgi:predicted acylesterase/phospholipase RssA